MHQDLRAGARQRGGEEMKKALFLALVTLWLVGTAGGGGAGILGGYLYDQYEKSQGRP
jgi:hypothetical protein